VLENRSVELQIYNCKLQIEKKKKKKKRKKKKQHTGGTPVILMGETPMLRTAMPRITRHLRLRRI